MKQEAGLPIAVILWYASLSLPDMTSSACSLILCTDLHFYCIYAGWLFPLGNSFHWECFGVSSARKYHPQLSSNGQLEGAAYVVSTNSVVHSILLSPFHLWNIFQELVCRGIQGDTPASLVSSGLSGAILTKKHKRYTNSTVLMLVFSFDDTPNVQKNV